MLVLGIETSCDETAAAIVDDNRQIHANIIHSQWREHAAYGGVVPEIASRAHLQHILPTINTALDEAGKTLAQMNAIAVTSGPGLIGGVIIGTMTAKALAAVSKKPILSINHLEGHALTVRLTDKVDFPYLLLLMSGGHCQFVLVKAVGKYIKLGGTIDDALGEAYDKVAKMLGLGYPGGPKVEALARKGNPNSYIFPVPLENQPNCNFSFSGLKTAVRIAIEKMPELSENNKADICASFQHAACKSIINRLEHALNTAHRITTGLSCIAIAGGVAANDYLRTHIKEFASNQNIALVCPDSALCTDNAAMIAWAGLERFKLGLENDLYIEPRARWPLDAI